MENGLSGFKTEDGTTGSSFVAALMAANDPILDISKTEAIVRSLLAPVSRVF